jgi:murein DD-endopeptidase MepM/ murein hydrolase activator NlpD
MMRTVRKKILIAVLAVGAIFALAWKAAEIPPPPVAMVSVSSPNAMTIPVAGVERGELRDSFSAARAGHRHEALDIMAQRGTPVLAAVDGTIRKLFTSAAGGITIYEFDDAETMNYYYAHLDAYAVGLREGNHVKRGEVIGYVGSTGNAPANAPHLHFAMAVVPPTKEWWKGQAIDPYPILMERGVTTPVSSLPGRPSDLGSR